MSPRTVRTFTTGAVASVALALTGTAVLSANQDAATRTIEKSSVREAPAVVDADRAGATAPRGQAVSAVLRDKALQTATLTDIPPAALAAYQRAAASMATASPGCHLPWTLLAGVGQVESDHGRTSARTAKGIVGVALNGNGVKMVADTDAGKLDGDTKHDRAVGPMQILPSTWATIAVDGDGDGTRDPQDIDDAALAAAVYLCGNGDDLATDAGTQAALRSYNNSASYVALVMAVAQAYEKDQTASAAVGATPAGLIDFRSVGTSYAGANDAGRVPAGKGSDAKAARKPGAPKPTAPATPTPTPGKGGTKPTTPTTPPGSGTPGTTPPSTTPGGAQPAPTWKFQVPGVVQLDVDLAVQRLANAKFASSQRSVFDPADAGTVVWQSVTGSAKRGTTVALDVSRGPVPNVVGLSYADALAALTDAGLEVAADPDGAPASDDAVVASQTPDPTSTRVTEGSTVTVTLAVPQTTPAG